MYKLLLALVLLLTISGCQTITLNDSVQSPTSWKIPEYSRANPNKITLDLYLGQYLRKHNTKYFYQVRSSEQPRQFEFAVESNPLILSQLRSTGLLSYLVFENGKITHDKITPVDRFGDQIQADALLYGMSFAKSVTS